MEGSSTVSRWQRSSSAWWRGAGRAATTWRASRERAQLLKKEERGLTVAGEKRNQMVPTDKEIEIDLFRKPSTR